MAKGKYLGLKRSPAPEERRECGEDGQKGGRHRGISLTYGAGKFNDYAVDGILGRDRGALSGWRGLLLSMPTIPSGIRRLFLRPAPAALAGPCHPS